jgi:hypothetical protein
MQEATDEVHNGLKLGKVPGAFAQEQLIVANYALHSLADIDENSRENLKYIKHEAAIEFEIAMGTGDKSSKELFVRKNDIAKNLWMTKTKAYIAQTFIMDSDSHKI